MPGAKKGSGSVSRLRAENTYKAFIRAKISACRYIWKVIGSEAGAAEFRKKVGPVFLVEMFLKRMDHSALPEQRMIAGWLLDVLSPGWRELVPVKLLGYVVDRDSPEVRKWRNAVLDRDARACRTCGSTKKLHAHHIFHWADAPEIRVDVSNGLTLCSICHAKAHSTGRMAFYA